MQNDPWNRAPLIKGPVGQFTIQCAACLIGAVYYVFQMSDDPTSRSAVVMLVMITVGTVVSVALLIRNLRERCRNEVSEQASSDR